MSSQAGLLTASNLLRRPRVRVNRKPLQQAGLTTRFMSFLSSLSSGKKIAFVVIGGLTFVSSSVWYLQPSDPDGALASLLARQGYYEIATPADLYMPGTINTIEIKSDGKLELHPTCKMDAAMLTKIAMESRTIDRNLALGLNKNFDISSEMQDLASAAIGGNRSAKVTMSLHNSHILLAADEDLLRIQHQLVKGSCAEAIELNIKNGGIVCQTRASLKGDLVYDVNYKQGLASKEKGELTKDLAATLNLSADQERADRLQGDGLIYGVKLMPSAINSSNASMPAECPSPAPSDRRRPRQT